MNVQPEGVLFEQRTTMRTARDNQEYKAKRRGQGAKLMPGTVSKPPKQSFNCGLSLGDLLAVRFYLELRLFVSSHRAAMALVEAGGGANQKCT